MKPYVIYDRAGVIHRTGMCPNADVENQPLKPGQAVMVGLAQPLTHKVTFDDQGNAAIVEIDPAEIEDHRAIREAARDKKPPGPPVDPDTLPAVITVAERRNLLDRLDDFEGRIAALEGAANHDRPR